MIYLAPDTNVLLHYTLFTEIDWPAVAEASDIILLFPATVIHELDARKYTGSDQRLQNRAQTVLRQIELAESNGPSNGSVAVAIAPAVPAAHLDELHLDPVSADDRILGELITFQRVHGVDVRFVTADYGARLKAKGHGLTCVVPSPDLRRNDPDPREQEVRDLRERIARYEAARPTLKPFLAVGDRRESFEQFEYVAVAPAGDSIEQYVARISERHHHAPRNGDRIEPKVWAEYDREWEAYLQHFREHVGAYWTYKNRTFFLQFGAENTSDVSANDVRLRLHLPDGFTVDDADGYKVPPLPKPPKRPLTPSEILIALKNMGSVNPVMTFPSYERSLPKPRFSAPRIQKSNSYDIDFSSLRIPQGDAVVWDPIVLRYDDTVEPTSFTIDYWLTIGNGFGITQGAFHVVFKERPPSAATSA